MAYTKNTWNTGDIVSSAKLNHMEDGIANAGGVMVINYTDNTLDKTWQEIYDAMHAGKLCIVRRDNGNLEGGIQASIVNVVFVEDAGSKYMVYTGSDVYSASSATGYPEYYVS